MSDCKHEFRETPIGWKCRKCGKIIYQEGKIKQVIPGGKDE